MSINKYYSYLTTILVSISLVKIAEAACPQGYDDVQGDCYKFYEGEGLDFTEAESFCADYGAHLAYIPDCNKFSNIIKYLKSQGAKAKGNGFWIGASDEVEEGYWAWSNGFPVRMGVPFWGTSGINWDPEPNGGPNENCAQLSNMDQFYFHDENCQGIGSPLCQIGNPLQPNNAESLAASKESKEEGYNYEDIYCPENFTYIGKSCFYFGIDVKKKTIEDSRTFCQSLNAALPVLKDCVEFQQLVEEIEKNYALGPNESYWIGATDYNNGNSWFWSDFTDMEKGSPFWGSTNGIPEPSGGNEQNCAILYKNDRYYFHDGECHTGTKILCQTSPYLNGQKYGHQ